MDTPAQMVHIGQMLFPQGIQHLQEYLFFELAHGLGAGNFFLGFVGGDNFVQNLLAQAFFKQLGVFFQPLLNRQINRHLGLKLGFETGDVPLFRHTLGRDVFTDQRINNVFPDGLDHVRNVVGRHDFVALVVDDRPLIVSHVVVFQQCLPHIEVAAFHLALGFLNGVGHHPVFNGLALLHAHRLHQALDPVRGKDAHKVVFQGKEEP